MVRFCYHPLPVNLVYSLNDAAFHDGLDLVSVHEELMEEFKKVKTSSRAKQSIESQVEAIVKARAVGLFDRPAHAHVSSSDIFVVEYRLSLSG